MKKLIFIGLVIVVFCQACYDPYKTDFDYTSTYFAMQKPHRVLVEEAGEDLSFKVGVVLAGKYTNDEEETVYFEIDPTLLDTDTTGKELLPESYYTLSSSDKFVIPSGEFMGEITDTMTDAYLNDPKAVGVNYVLPLRITDATTDSILGLKSTTQIALSYHNMYYGAYYVKGGDIRLNPFGNPVDTIAYTNKDLSQNIYRISSSLSKDTLTLGYLGQDKTGDNVLKLAVKDDGSVSVHEHSVDSIATMSNVYGTGSYSSEDKTFYLEYKYTIKGSERQVLDTLIHFAMPMEVKEW